LVGIDSFTKGHWMFHVTFGLQALNVLSKAALAILLARCLPLTDMGLVGMLVVTISFAGVAVGLSFHKFSVRELLRRGRGQAPRILRDQTVVHLLAYVVAWPALLLLFASGIFPGRLLCWFYILLVLEHIGQELQQLLVTFDRPQRAALLLFVRQGLWVHGLIVVLYCCPTLATINTVCAGWAAGGLGAVVVATYWLRDLRWWTAREAIDWDWILRGLKVASPFLLATLALTATSVIDRYAVFYFCGAEATGVYTFYLYGRNAIQSLLEVGVGIIFQTRILMAFQIGRSEDYRSIVSSFATTTAVWWLIMIVGAGLAIGPIVALIGKPLYLNQLGAFWVVLLIPLGTVLSSFFQLALYARGHDWRIATNAVIGLLVAVVLNAVLVPRLSVLGAAIGTLGAVSLVAVLNWRAFGIGEPAATGGNAGSLESSASSSTTSSAI
jgi:O-antigen/teichoic acid export membrane protein